VRVVTAGSRREIEAGVETLAAGLLSRRSDGLTLDRVEFEREGREWFLRVFLDHPAGVTLDHCRDVARELGEALDRVDPISHTYNLEVSSPGLERPLLRDSDYDRFRGRLATLRLYRTIGGRKAFTGRLGGLTPSGEVLIEAAPGEEVKIPRAEIAKAHLAIDWSKVGGATDVDSAGGDGSGRYGGEGQ